MIVFGHSLGGVVAPSLDHAALRGIIVYGTIAERWLDYMMENFLRQDRLAGLDEETIEERQALRRAFQTALLEEGLSPGEIVARLPGTAVLVDVDPDTPDLYYGRAPAFYQQLARWDPDRAWQRVAVPVLALHGEYDWVSAHGDHARIARLTGGKTLDVPAMDHGFRVYTSLPASFHARRTGPFGDAIVDITVRWIRGLNGSQPVAQCAAGALHQTARPSGSQRCGAPWTAGDAGCRS